MGITRRFLNLARSNLSDFRFAFDRDLREELRTEPSAEVSDTASSDEDSTVHDQGSVGSRAGRRARRFRDAAEEAWEQAFAAAQARAAGDRSSRKVNKSSSHQRRWYKTLELEPGADLQTVQKAYRRLLKQYHPDKFAQEPDKYKAATEVTRNITEAYKGLCQLLRE